MPRQNSFDRIPLWAIGYFERASRTIGVPVLIVSSSESNCQSQQRELMSYARLYKREKLVGIDLKSRIVPAGNGFHELELIAHRQVHFPADIAPGKTE